MRLPKFDLSNLPVQVDSDAYLKAVLAEENRVCGPLDARIKVLEDEFCALGRAYKLLSEKYDQTDGFFARWSIRNDMKLMLRRISDNRHMRSELTVARWRRTYA